MKADINEVAALFHIAKAAHEHGDTFKHIRAAALAALHEINAEHDPKAMVEEQVDEPEQTDTMGAIETQRRV